jgi:EAL domain-containing protein (putative c-di-GMP-specific phosphodiesterase class I)
VVAEGIENAEAWKLLAALACDEAQGYFIAKPMPSDQFVGWVKQWRPPEATQAFLGMDLVTVA